LNLPLNKLLDFSSHNGIPYHVSFCTLLIAFGSPLIVFILHFYQTKQKFITFRGVMKFKFIFFVLVICLGGATIPDREPDIKSVPAKLEDYYTFDKETGKWIWTDDYIKIKTAKVRKKQLARLAALKAKVQEQKPQPEQKAQKSQEKQENQEKQDVQPNCSVQTEIIIPTPNIQKLNEVSKTPETVAPVAENKKVETKELKFYERWWIKIKQAFHKDVRLLKNLIHLKD